jgi:hypothetical protein
MDILNRSLIVAKVDQFMALCDELEAKLNEGQPHSKNL